MSVEQNASGTPTKESGKRTKPTGDDTPPKPPAKAVALEVIPHGNDQCRAVPGCEPPNTTKRPPVVAHVKINCERALDCTQH